MIIKSLRKIFTQTEYILVMLISFFVMLLAYYLAIEFTGGWNNFVNSNSNIYIFLQIILSLTNAILAGIAIAMLVYVFKAKKSANNFNNVQTLLSLFFSLATTGCYVCGTVLLPTIGIGVSLVNLPFGGLEVKALTILLMIYAIREYSKIITGVCDWSKPTLYVFNLNNRFNIKINSNHIAMIKNFSLMIGFALILLLLPSLNIKSGLLNTENRAFCPYSAR